jgi:hypothetical protein
MYSKSLLKSTVTILGYGTAMSDGDKPQFSWDRYPVVTGDVSSASAGTVFSQFPHTMDPLFL